MYSFWIEARMRWSCRNVCLLPLRMSAFFVLDADSAYRVDESDLNTVPIPVHPIGYDDAWHLLRYVHAQ